MGSLPRKFNPLKPRQLIRQTMVGIAVAVRQKSAVRVGYVALWGTFAAALAVLQRQDLVALRVLARPTPAPRHGHAVVQPAWTPPTNVA